VKTLPQKWLISSFQGNRLSSTWNTVDFFVARILVIDDDPDMRVLLEQTLKSAGHEAVLAADGSEGVERYHANPADLVITDLYMPNQEGLETIAELRRRSPDVPIIAISGRAAAETMLSIAMKLGALEVLQKPFLIEDLLITVSRALGGKDPDDNAAKKTRA